MGRSAKHNQRSRPADRRTHRKKGRQDRKASLIREALSQVSSYVCRLKQDGEISATEYWDSDLRADLEEAVGDELDGEVFGDEDSKEVTEPGRKIIHDELE